MASSYTPRKKALKINRREGDIVKRITFFKAVDSRDFKPLKLVYEEENIPSTIAERWLQ